MACAGYTRSVAYSHEGVNPRSTEKSQSRARCAARLAVMVDKRLPMGARVLYALLDNYAGMRAECWPHQQTAASQIGRSVRTVKRWISDLVSAGYITIRRTQSGNRYRLAWLSSVPESNAADIFGPSEVPSSARPYIQPDKELRGCNSNSIGSTQDWEFGLDDAVGLFLWAERQQEP